MYYISFIILESNLNFKDYFSLLVIVFICVKNVYCYKLDYKIVLYINISLFVFFI